jgi:hypothetical protein
VKHAQSHGAQLPLFDQCTQVQPHATQAIT